MIKLHTKIVGYDDDSGYIQCKKFDIKKTNTLEHICAIHLLVSSIMDNDKNMTINRLCEIIKENYKKDLESEDE